MSWQNNRRRKRAWYRRFETISENLKAVVAKQDATALDILQLFHGYSMAMRLYKYDWIKESAVKSLELLAKDKELDKYKVTVKYEAPF